VACNVAKGLKGFERKGIKAQKTVCGFSLFYNKNYQPGLVKDSSSFCWDHFLPLLFFFPWYKHSLFVNIIFDLMTYFCL